MSAPSPDPAREARILADLEDAVGRMHVVADAPRVVVCAGRRAEGARPMAWQVLFERSLGAGTPTLVYRGAPATALHTILTRGSDSAPLSEAGWAHRRIGLAMAQGPVVQAFRIDRLHLDTTRALVGVLVFEEDELDHSRVLDALRVAGIPSGNAQDPGAGERM